MLSCVVPAIPGVEWIFRRDDVRAVPTHEHPDTVVEGADSWLGHRALLDD